jgi:hypothetical protein
MAVQQCHIMVLHWHWMVVGSRWLPTVCLPSSREQCPVADETLIGVLLEFGHLRGCPSGVHLLTAFRTEEAGHVDYQEGEVKGSFRWRRNNVYGRKRHVQYRIRRLHNSARPRHDVQPGALPVRHRQHVCPVAQSVRIHPVHQHFLGVLSADRSRHRKHAIPSSRVRRYEGDFGAGPHDRGSLRRDSRERSAVLERTSPEVHAQAVSVIVDAIGDV